MDSFQDDQNCQFFVALAQSVGALIVSLIDRAKRECPVMQEAFRTALVPTLRVLADFLGHSPGELTLAEQSYLLRDVHVNPIRTLPSLQHHFHPRISPPVGGGCWPAHSITALPNDITPPPTPSRGWPNSPLGFTSTPVRVPPGRLAAPPEQFALINQLLTAVRTSEDSMARVTDRFVNDPIFRERMLSELDDLGTLLVAQRPEQGTCSSAASQAISALLDRVGQAEITLSSLIHNLQQLQSMTLPAETEKDEDVLEEERGA